MHAATEAGRAFADAFESDDSMEELMKPLNYGEARALASLIRAAGAPETARRAMLWYAMGDPDFVMYDECANDPEGHPILGQLLDEWGIAPTDPDEGGDWSFELVDGFTFGGGE